MGLGGDFADKETVENLFHTLFSWSSLLPVTANAGLINPGNTGRIVYENVTEGRNIDKYFRVGEPFALVIPVPFSDGSHDAGYTSHRARQQGIVF